MPKIDKMFAYVVADKNTDDEGIVSMQMPNGLHMPLVGADMERAEALKPYAETIATTLNKEIKLIEFSSFKQISVIKPGG